MYLLDHRPTSSRTRSNITNDTTVMNAVITATELHTDVSRQAEIPQKSRACYHTKAHPKLVV